MHTRGRVRWTPLSLLRDSVRPNRVSRTKAHRKSGGSYTLQLTRLRVGSLMVQQQQQQSLPQRAGQGTLVAEVLVEAATRLEVGAGTCTTGLWDAT